jgi:hypothetical protein
LVKARCYQPTPATSFDLAPLPEFDISAACRPAGGNDRRTPAIELIELTLAALDRLGYLSDLESRNLYFEYRSGVSRLALASSYRSIPVGNLYNENFPTCAFSFKSKGCEAGMFVAEW